MVELPGTGAAPPVAQSRTSLRTSAKAGPSRIAVALLATGVGVSLVVPLAIAIAYPDLLPLATPLAIFMVAVALWGVAKVDQFRLAGEVRRLSDENAHLAQNLGWLADTTRELRESQRELDDARRRAEAASQAKSRLLATVSHEFRTPLNGILGLTGLLLETEQTPDQATYARAVHSSGEALLALVDDMLDFSKIEAGRLDLRPEPTDLAALLQEIAELLAGRAHGKGIDIAVAVTGPLQPALVDAHRLRQVLLNLAGNGVKFTDRGGVTLSAECSVRTEPGRLDVVFGVADTGPGIPADAVGRLFREFEQLDPAPTRRHGGAGLGLAISRRIVRAMGGEVEVGARPGGGAVFSFRLSLPITAAASPEDPPSLAKRALLILAPWGAEPPAIAAELAQAGAEVRIASTAYEAGALVGAAAAAAQPYDGMLVDARAVPDPSATLAQLRDATGLRIPAAVLIEPGRRIDVEAFRAGGFDAYLVRPVRRTSLLRVVADIVSRSGTFCPDPGDVRPRRAVTNQTRSRAQRVLLAEDNEINALLARAVLEGMGHTVDEVRDGAAAVAAATGQPGKFPLVLMDLHMPGIDGLAAVRAIRAHERQTGIAPARIVAVTADVLAETREAALASGVDQVLEKPMTPAALRRALAVVADAA